MSPYFTVTYSIEDGTATLNSDYVLTSGTLTIPTGRTTARSFGRVLGDTTVEPDETIRVNISSDSSAVSASFAAITLTNADGTTITPNLKGVSGANS